MASPAMLTNLHGFILLGACVVEYAGIGLEFKRLAGTPQTPEALPPLPPPSLLLHVSGAALTGPPSAVDSPPDPATPGDNPTGDPPPPLAASPTSAILDMWAAYGFQLGYYVADVGGEVKACPRYASPRSL
jgi:hypothetical protein